ncbi:unnamed protein product [Durusdinium trenchii]|uniref:Uncharacterized protein n=1 Tax=Durusdinium trenchii TaxID=1381693 RepID=A0ABP0PI90_9DINO
MVLVLAQSLQASSKIAQTDRSRRLCRRDHGWHALIHFGQQQLQSWQSANEWMGLDCHSQEALCESQLASARKLHLPMKSSQRGLHPSSSKSMSAAGRLAALERLSCSTYVFSRSSSSGPWKWHCISTPALHSFAAAPYKAQLLVHDVAFASSWLMLLGSAVFAVWWALEAMRGLRSQRFKHAGCTTELKACLQILRLLCNQSRPPPLTLSGDQRRRDM